MRFSPAICLFTMIAGCCATSLRAQEQPSWQARFAARHDLELAKIELRNYWLVEYPRQVRELNAAIELTQAEICNNQALQNEYRPFTQFTIGEPFPITIQNLQMCLKAAEIRLKNLQAEKMALIRFHGDQFRFLELKVQVARQRVADLEANDVVESEPAPK